MHSRLARIRLRPLRLLLSCLLVSSSCDVLCAVADGDFTDSVLPLGNPFTPAAYLRRYWEKEIRGQKSPFLFSKASPLTAVDSAKFAKLAAQNSLSAYLPEFCAAAKLICFPDLSPSLQKHTKPVDFGSYSAENFTNYGTGRLGGVDSFRHYSDNENLPINSFRRYGHSTTDAIESFDSYGTNTNVADQSFNSYSGGATAGLGEFNHYNTETNVPHLTFGSYADEANGNRQDFKTYADSGNAGTEGFTNYGKRGNAATNNFLSYGKETNVITSGFSSYSKNGNGGNDSFKSYADDGNNPHSTFNSYGEGGNAGLESFTSYRDQSNVGEDSFQSYAKDSNAKSVQFSNYGNSFNEGNDLFKVYGKAATTFNTYGSNDNTSFIGYEQKKLVDFSRYSKGSGNDTSAATRAANANRWVEPGKFFRESKLKKGNVMRMPNIRDKMPQRSFLPRSIASKLPFSSSKLAEMKQLFHAGENSTMEAIFRDALGDCERAPSQGETKRCVASVEDMIDFATSVLGRNIVVRTTKNTQGSNRDILIGSLTRINKGQVTKSVSCHQSLFPYLLYYCHSVPKVRVYEADILDPKNRTQINHGVAICHLDTSAWSPNHGAFLALGQGPGRIEVCHWIFENDMTWTIAD